MKKKRIWSSFQILLKSTQIKPLRIEAACISTKSGIQF